MELRLPEHWNKKSRTPAPQTKELTRTFSPLFGTVWLMKARSSRTQRAGWTGFIWRMNTKMLFHVDWLTNSQSTNALTGATWDNASANALKLPSSGHSAGRRNSFISVASWVWRIMTTALPTGKKILHNPLAASPYLGNWIFSSSTPMQGLSESRPRISASGFILTVTKSRPFWQRPWHLDCIPVLIARRIPFVTFKVLSTCGVLLHQTYNQLLPATEHDLADKARDKHLLGYHDIRVGNQPDNRLLKFIGTNLPRILPQAREKFDMYKDLIAKFTNSDMRYKEFSARVRRRDSGTNEDYDDPAEHPDYSDYLNYLTNDYI